MNSTEILKVERDRLLLFGDVSESLIKEAVEELQSLRENPYASGRISIGTGRPPQAPTGGFGGHPS